LMFLNIQIDLIILKTFDQQFTLTTKKSLHIIFKRRSSHYRQLILHLITTHKLIKFEVAMNTGRRTFSPWATNTGKNNRWISTFHSIGGALCLSLCRSFFDSDIAIFVLKRDVKLQLTN